MGTEQINSQQQEMTHMLKSTPKAPQGYIWSEIKRAKDKY
jgi:hypothetical protein